MVCPEQGIKLVLSRRPVVQVEILKAFEALGLHSLIVPAHPSSPPISTRAASIARIASGRETLCFAAQAST